MSTVTDAAAAILTVLAVVGLVVAVPSFLTNWAWRRRRIVSLPVGDGPARSGRVDESPVPTRTDHAVCALTDLPADATSRRLEDEAGVALLAMAAADEDQAQLIAAASLSDVTDRIEAEVERRRAADMATAGPSREARRAHRMLGAAAEPAAARGSLLTQHLTAACWWISLVLLGGLAGFLWSQGSPAARIAAGAALVVAAIVLVRQILTTPHKPARPNRVNS